jgi:hypothetical protein
MPLPIKKPNPPQVATNKDELERPGDSPFTPPPELQTDHERGTGELGTEGSDPAKPIHGTNSSQKSR